MPHEGQECCISCFINIAASPFNLPFPSKIPLPSLGLPIKCGQERIKLSVSTYDWLISKIPATISSFLPSATSKLEYYKIPILSPLLFSTTNCTILPQSLHVWVEFAPVKPTCRSIPFASLAISSAKSRVVSLAQRRDCLTIHPHEINIPR
jgi:hypothetical protein